MIVDSEVRGDEFTVVAEVALNDMSGYFNLSAVKDGIQEIARAAEKPNILLSSHS